MAYRVTKSMYTETGHRLTGYDGACGNLHGHSYKWSVTIESDNLNKHGFVIDYKSLKESMLSTIGLFDHAFILYRCDPLVKNNTPDELVNLFRNAKGEIGNLIISPLNPSSENLIKIIYDKLSNIFNNSNLRIIKIKLQETESSFCEVIYE